MCWYTTARNCEFSITDLRCRDMWVRIVVRELQYLYRSMRSTHKPSLNERRVVDEGGQYGNL